MLDAMNDASESAYELGSKHAISEALRIVRQYQKASRELADSPCGSYEDRVSSYRAVRILQSLADELNKIHGSQREND